MLIRRLSGHLRVTPLNISWGGELCTKADGTSSDNGIYTLHEKFIIRLGPVEARVERYDVVLPDYDCHRMLMIEP